MARRKAGAVPQVQHNKGTGQGKVHLGGRGFYCGGLGTPDRKAKIHAAVAALDASLPAWAKRDWRWQEIVTSCNRFK